MNKFLFPLFFLLHFVFINLPAQDLTNGLVACYSFSGSALDGTSNHNDGTVHGATLTTDRFGSPNSAYQFDGFSNYISIPGAAMANPSYSYSAWIYLTSFPSDGNTGNIISVGDATSKHQTVNVSNYYSSAGSTGLTCGGFNNGSPNVTAVQTGIIPTIPNWFHLVSTRDNNIMSLYVNGQLIGTSSTNNTTPYYGSPVTANIGTRCSFFQFFQGIIDDVSIYNRALTAQEALLLYQQGIVCTISTPPPTAPNVSICSGGTAELTASGGTTYRWYDAPVNGNLLFTGNPFVTPNLTANTDYYVVNVQNNIESTRVKVTVTVFSSPLLSCSITTQILLQDPATVAAYVSSGTSPFTYQFNFGDGAILTTPQPNATHQYINGGNYPLSVSVSDANNCHNSCSGNINVLGELFVPNVMTVNSDKLNDHLTVFIKAGTGYAPYLGSTPFSMSVFNRWGKPIFQTHDAVAGWDGGTFDAGTYYFTIALGDWKYKGWVALLR